MRSRFKFFLFALMWLTSAGAQSSGVANFTLLDLYGKMHQLSDYRGKWVVVNYWATWCPPCLEEIPELEVFHSNHKDTDAVVLGVNMEDIDLERLLGFVEEQFISYPVLRSAPGLRSELGQVPGLPTSYLVSPKGQVVARQVGPITARILEAYLEKQHGENARKGVKK